MLTSAKRESDTRVACISLSAYRPPPLTEPERNAVILDTDGDELKSRLCKFAIGLKV